MKKREKFTAEAAAHAIVHLLGVLLLFWVVSVPPLWVAFILIVIEQLQIMAFGNCILTRFAHKRGYMIGMSYWEYIPYMLGVKDYKKAQKGIDRALKIALIGILLIRILLTLWTFIR
jgi:hypothetical protein